MNKLEALASITRLSKRVIRVLGQNPGEFTLQGTNTYLIGRDNPYTLIDAAQGLPEYLTVLEETLRGIAQPKRPTEPDVSDIIISHWHHDHTGGLPSVLGLLRRLWEERNGSIPFTPPRLHKFPLPSATNRKLSSVLENISPSLYTSSPDNSPFHDLVDSQKFVVNSEDKNDSTTLHVVHTPGHTTDSISLLIPEDKALYTADTVLGQGTAVFEDLGSYIASLQKMLNASADSKYTLLYPGHGPVVADGPKLIETYIKHRLDREAEVLRVLTQPPTLSTPPDNPAVESHTTWSIVERIYAKYPQSLWLPAARGIDLHLRKLEGEGKIRCIGGEGKETKWELLAKL